MSRWIRCTLSAFVLVCLTAGSAQALPVHPAFAAPEAIRLRDAAWSWLVGRLRLAKFSDPRQAGSKPSDQQKYGCGMDPDGKPRPCAN